MPTPRLTRSDIDPRIIFHEDDHIMEVSFENLSLANSVEVNTFYDRIEERIAETGEELWFFLVNYSHARIDSRAWIAFSRRGKELNLAHSMGSVRFDATEATRRRIERDANTEAFDPNLFADRKAAIEALRALPTRRRKRKKVRTPTLRLEDVDWRIGFIAGQQIMDVDFSKLSFKNSRDVDLVYDFIEDRLEETGCRWFFLVNYEETDIQTPAWVQFARRGKKLNEEWSLGSVRYAPGSETEAEIRLRAESQGFRPNIRNTRQEARARIEEMRAEMEQGAHAR